MRFPVFFMWTPQLSLRTLRYELQQRNLLHGALQASQPEGSDGHIVPLALLMRDGKTGPLQLPPFRNTHCTCTRSLRDATPVSQPVPRGSNCKPARILRQYAPSRNMARCLLSCRVIANPSETYAIPPNGRQASLVHVDAWRCRPCEVRFNTNPGEPSQPTRKSFAMSRFGSLGSDW
jgi:hypothetical protein